MADTKDYYLQNCQTLIPWGSVASGNYSTGASIIILTDASLSSSTMMANLEALITDFYSYNATGSSSGDMTHWATGSAATSCVYTATSNAFNPYATAGALYTWITSTLGSASLNFQFGSTVNPTGVSTGGIAPTTMTQQVAICNVLNSSGNVDTTKLAIVVATPAYRSGSTPCYRGVTKFAARFTSTACPTTVTVTAYPAIIKANCVTSVNELILPGAATNVSSC
jgi:hypothetical protein